MYRVRSPVLRFDLCALPYFLRPFPDPYRTGVPGRLAPVGSDRASQRGYNQGFIAFLVGEAGQSRKWCFGSAFRLERLSKGGLETEASAPVGEAGQSRKQAAFLLGQAFRSVIGSPF